MYPSGSKLWPETILKPPRQFYVPEAPSHNPIVQAPNMDYYLADSESNLLMEQRRPGVQPLCLPVEIVMLVLTTFQDNRKMLKTCSLVCKLWLSCARYYLIPSRFAIYLTATTARDIFDIFKSPCVMLGSYIYHYSIHKQYARPPLTYQENSSNRPVQDVDFYNCLHPFPGIFNRLRVLTLHDIGSLSSTDFKPIIPLIPSFESLTELRLRRCTFSTQKELFSVLCAKRTLTRFILEEIIIRDPHDHLPYSSKLRLPGHLTHIGLFTMGQRYIIDWILGQKYIPPITSLCFGGVGEPDDQRAIGYLLMALGPHLKHLKIYIPNWNNEFSLSHNTKLQSLSISHYRLADLGDSEGASAAALLDILNQISSTNVTIVNLRFISKMEGFRTMPWASFAKVLQSSKYGNLKMLRVKSISMAKGEELEVLEKTLQRYFRGLSSRGALQLLWEDDSDSEDA